MNASEAINQAHTALTEAAAALDALEALLLGQPDATEVALKGFDLAQLIGPAISRRVRYALDSLEGEGCTPPSMR